MIDVVRSCSPARLGALFGALVTLGAACSPDPAPEPVASGVPPATETVARDERLLEATGRGDAEAVDQLIESGVDLELVDAADRTALVVASYAADLAVARLLIEAGADVNHQDQTKQSAYLIATSEIGPDDGLELLRLTLEHGADVGSLDSFNGTGLIRAAHRGYGDIVDELLRAGIEVDHVNGLGWTALLEAIILGDGGPGHTRVVDLLLAAGADPDLADEDGVTPLEHARSHSYDTIAEALLAAGATPSP